MVVTKTNRVSLDLTAQTILRVVIASYFLASGLGLMPGADLAPLVALVAPEGLVAPLSSLLVFGLGFLVMIGVCIRPAALVLGAMTFFASYLKALELGVGDEIGTFWRDLVMVAALMLTHAEKSPRDSQTQRVTQTKVVPRRVVLTHPSTDKRPPATPRTTTPVLQFRTRPRAVQIEPLEPVDNIFAEFDPAAA